VALAMARRACRRRLVFVIGASVALLAAGCRGKGTVPAGATTAAATGTGGATGVVTYRSVPLMDVRDGKVADGEGVTVEVALVTATIVHTSETRSGGPVPGSSERYFMLALPADAPYLKALAGIRDELTKLGAELAALKPGKTPADLGALLERHDALAKKLDETKVVPSEAVAVELDGFDAGRMRVTWEKVVQECTGTFCLSIPTIPRFAPLTFDRCAFGGDAKTTAACVGTAEERVAKLASFDPPGLAEEMPKLPPMLGVDDQALIARYNKLVPRFNKEVERRSAAVAAALPGRVERLARVAAVASGERWTLRGVVRPVSALATRLYRETFGSAPAHQIQEIPLGPAAFASTTYAKTRYCFTSQPTGADIVAGGASSGRTPTCLDGLRTGEDVEIRLELPGRAPARIEPSTVRASPGNLTEIDCVLAKTGSAGTSTCRLAY
jgi:hypothetical protein